jgi:hypothetical protein
MFLAACSPDNNGPLSPDMSPATFPRLAAFDPTVVQVCVDLASPPAAYTFTAISTSNLQPTDVLTSPLIIDTSLPGPICGNILTRVPTGTNGEVALVTVHATTAAAGTFSFTCTDDIGGSSCSPASGTNDAIAGESSFHGSSISFLFVADPPVGACEYSQGYYKTHPSSVVAALASPAVSTYVTAGGKLDVSGGLNRIVGTADDRLTAAQAANNLIPANAPASMRQLITAELNVTRGAPVNATVQDAIDGLRAYFAGVNGGDVGGWTKTLDDYNNGLIVGSHCD